MRKETLTTTPLNACELFKGAYRTGKQIEEAKRVVERTAITPGHTGFLGPIL